VKIIQAVYAIYYKYRSYSHSVKYLILSQIIVIIFSFISTFVLIRSLTLEEYGLFVLVISLEGRFGVIALPGMNFVLQKALLKGNNCYQIIQKKILQVSFFIGLIIVAIASVNLIIVDEYIGPFVFLNEFKWEFLIVAIFFIIPKNLNKYEIYLISIEEYRSLFFYRLLQVLLYFLFVACVAYIFNSLYYVLFGVFIYYLILLIYTNKRLNNITYEKLVTEDCIDASNVLKDGYKYSLLNLNAFFFRFERIVLGTISPELLGLYHVAEKIPDLVKNALKNFITPLLVKKGKGCKSGNFQWIKDNKLLLLLFGIGGLLLSYLLTHLLYMQIFTEEYADGMHYSYLLSIPIIFIFINTILNSYDIVQNDGSIYRKYYFFHSIIFGVIAYIAIPLFGIMGMLYAVFGVTLLHIFCSINIYHDSNKSHDNV
jgi:O-antigen/teichoic acid export membrane protein